MAAAMTTTRLNSLQAPMAMQIIMVIATTRTETTCTAEVMVTVTAAMQRVP
jgi:hypothetical protein